MNFAYSLIKRDYIFAESCNYDDTSNLQTRCPFCYEPVFLKAGNSKKNHFSHYSESFNSKECELRAKSFYKNYSDFVTETKGQTLLKHYKSFSYLYAIYMGVPKDIVFFTTELYENLVISCKELILNGTTQLELELQQNHMKEFLILSLKSLLNCIINFKLEIPQLNLFYELYLESINQFLKCFEKRYFDLDELGVKFIKQKLNEEQNSENKLERLYTQITTNSDYIVNTLSKRFSIEEIHTICFCLLQRENKEIGLCLKKLKQSILQNNTKSYKTITGKIGSYVDAKSIQHISNIDFFKISLFLGQENAFAYEHKSKIKKNVKIQFLLINPNINFFERLSKITVFSTSIKSDFYKYFKWGPIVKRHYKIMIRRNIQDYLNFYNNEQNYYKNVVEFEKENNEKRQEIEKKRQPEFIIHKRNNSQKTQKTICKICQKEIQTFRLVNHLKTEHPKHK